MKFLLIQAVGAVAFALLSFSYFKKEKKDILVIQILATIAFSIHYYFLSGLTGTICNILSLISLIIIYLFEKHSGKNKKLLILCIIPLLILISLFTYENIFSIFPVIASTVVLISFLLSDENKIRISGIVSAVCWLIYAIKYKSYVAMIFEIFIIITTILAFFENRNFKKKNNKKDC